MEVHKILYWYHGKPEISKTYIAASSIRSVEDSSVNCKIIFENGDAIFVKDSYEEIKEMLLSAILGDE